MSNITKQQGIVIDIKDLPPVTMVSGARLHNRSCDEIMDRDADLTDPVPDPMAVLLGELVQRSRYEHDLLYTEADDEPRNIALPPGIIHLLERERSVYGYDWRSEVIRRHALHGLARHNFLYGDSLHSLLENDVIGVGIESNDKKVLKIVGDITKCNFVASRSTTCRFSQDFWNLIEGAREEAGVKDKEKWITFLIALSLLDSERFVKWHDVFDQIVKTIHSELELRVENIQTAIENGKGEYL